MIEIKGLKKQFDDTVVFSDMNLEIQDGEFVVFAGKSGCGKTTLLNIIGGLENPTEGMVLVNGTDISRTRRKQAYFMKEVGFLFQNFALIENHTVRWNLNLVQKKARSKISVEEALEMVGLSDKADTMVYKLSGGEQQRVALARLLFKQCSIILADEPTGSLDTQNADAVMDILHRMNGNGKTVILVTHNERIIEEERRVVYL